MEGKIYELVQFALGLIEYTDKPVDYYAALSGYCCDHVYDPITGVFNEVIGTRGGVTLFYTRLQIELLEKEIIQNPNNKREEELKQVRARYQERLEEYLVKKERNL